MQFHAVCSNNQIEARTRQMALLGIVIVKLHDLDTLEKTNKRDQLINAKMNFICNFILLLITPA